VPGYNATDDNFDHIGQAFLSLYVLVTTENFPQVMSTNICIIFSVPIGSEIFTLRNEKLHTET
jgi:hypothetical protein